MTSPWTRAIAEHRTVLARVSKLLGPQVQESADRIVEALETGHKVLLVGNGGSAADAQHIAAELSGRYTRERQGLAAVALTTDTSALTAISNDYGFERVFERQVEALARPGDVLIAISTSGNSPNVLRAVWRARELGCSVIGWAGKDGGRLAGLCDLPIVVPSEDTARIQEMHILVGHVLCDLVEEAMTSQDGTS